MTAEALSTGNLPAWEILSILLMLRESSMQSTGWMAQFYGNLYVGSSFLKSQLSFDAETGEEQWRTSKIDGVSFAEMAVNESSVFAGAVAVPGLIFEGFLSEGGLIKLDRESGEIDWFFSTPENPHVNEFGVLSSPLLLDNTVYIGALDGKYYAVKEKVTEFPILNFSIDRDELKKGEKTVLRWDVVDDVKVTLNGRRVAKKDSKSIRICKNKTFTLRVNGRLQETQEISVQVKPVEEINIAKFGTASSSSSENKDQFGASFAIDGDPTTRWSSAFSNGEFITLDLGRKYSLDRIRIIWEGAYASSYRIEASRDIHSWSTIFSTDDNSGGTNDIENLDIKARYLRLTGDERATPYGTSIWEFEVYEKPNEKQLKRLARKCKRRWCSWK